MRKSLIALIAVVGLLFVGSAVADIVVKDGTSTSRTIKTFVCETTKLCYAYVPIKSDGTEIGTSSAPVRTDPTGTTTQPVSASALPLPTGAATSANQSTTNTSIGATNEGAAGADTATSGLNGLIKRLLQSITTLNGKIDTLNGNVTSAIPAGTAVIGKVGVDQTTPGTTNAVSVPLRAAGGWTPSRLSGLSTTVTAIKSSAAGSLGMLVCGNPNASIIFIQVFDVATAGGVTLGTTAPTLSFQVDASSTVGFALPINGMAFANGIQMAATTTATNNTAPGTAANCNAGFN